jgi:Asp-tRNA(Asn)/Glu-tRNA(Gln) amidotransferase B subunit
MPPRLYIESDPIFSHAMKASKGKANPAQMNEILKKKLAG